MTGQKEADLGNAMRAFEINAGRPDPRIKIRAAAVRRGVPMSKNQKRVLKYLQTQVEPISAKAIAGHLNVSSHQAGHWLRHLCDKGFARSAKVNVNGKTLYKAVNV